MGKFVLKESGKSKKEIKEDKKATKLASYVFTGMFKLVRGDRNFDEEIEFAQNYI